MLIKFAPRVRWHELEPGASMAADDQLNEVIRAIAAAEIASGRERGLQIVAYHNGQCIVDVCAGRTAAGYALAPSATIMPYSVTKGVAATVIARAIDMSAGRVHYTDPVAAHWHAFSPNGKGRISIADALSHRAGLRARSLCPLLLPVLLICGRAIEGMALGVDWIACCVPSWRRHAEPTLPSSAH